MHRRVFDALRSLMGTEDSTGESKSRGARAWHGGGYRGCIAAAMEELSVVKIYIFIYLIHIRV